MEVNQPVLPYLEPALELASGIAPVSLGLFAGSPSLRMRPPNIGPPSMGPHHPGPEKAGRVIVMRPHQVLQLFFFIPPILRGEK